MRSFRSVAAACAVVLLATAFAACTADDKGATTTIAAPVEVSATTDAPATTVTVAAATTTTLPIGNFQMFAGVNQLAVVDEQPDTSLSLMSTDGTIVISGVADEQGSLLWRNLPAGAFRVSRGGESPAISDTVTVLAESDVPPESFYSEQQLPAGGFGYITTRDGTTLSTNVMLPGPVDGGPYPTIVEYSGYTPSDPANTTFGQLFNALGYAYVGVNMRGTGCSGGSYLFFERAQSIDGYDVIEAVAAQPWVFDHRVGMGGISYPGISQLFVASTAPPSLAAITPLSVIDDSYRATLYPGGILNTGFGEAFGQERYDEAKPYGQEWTRERADEGDEVCATNQHLRLQNPDAVALIADNPFYDPTIYDVINPSTFVDQIEVPVFLAGAWQDEQTGGHFPDMLDDFRGTDHLYVDLVNGLHTESLSPTIFARAVEFLDLYVAKRTPSLAGARSVAQVLVPQLYGVSEVTFPDDRFTGMSYDDALAAFENEPAIRVLFEEGAAEDTQPGAPYPRFIETFTKWPIESAQPTTWYLDDGGLLATDAPPDAGSDVYTADPDALPPAFYPGGRSSDIWRADTTYDWRPIPNGTGLGYTTDPLAADTVIIGSGAVTLWVESRAADTDVEVTISEVRPDGSELYVQSGWLRLSQRALDEAASTAISPVHTHLEADAAPLPASEPTEVAIELFPFAHAFRAGSQIRITIDAPGNSRPVWEFATVSAGETVIVSYDPEHPSTLVLPVVAGIIVPPGAPPCGALRGQPCRTFEPMTNEVGRLGTTRRTR